MVELQMLEIQSYKGAYQVHFAKAVEDGVALLDSGKTFHYVIDSNVLELHGDKLNLDSAASVFAIVADEQNKSLDRFSGFVEQLLVNGVKRDHTLIAIGGGIIQDITCFLAATLFRGMRWCFLPTTLLAQADSCIGSKSSINVGDWKNILGTFTPPNQIVVVDEFLTTLSDADLRSGIGEMLKIQMIAGAEEFNAIVEDYDKLFTEPEIRHAYIHASLKVKQGFIEQDEFDKGVRNILNFGHSFGHAIESATNFGVPHGIAVTIGMDMANYVSYRTGRWAEADFKHSHGVFRKNSSQFLKTSVSTEGFMKAISKDKKNLGKNLSLILPNQFGQLEKVSMPGDDTFVGYVKDYFDQIARV